MTRLDRYEGRLPRGTWIARGCRVPSFDTTWILARVYQRVRGGWVRYWRAEFSFFCRYYGDLQKIGGAYVKECYVLDDADLTALRLLDEDARHDALTNMIRAEEERAR